MKLYYNPLYLQKWNIVLMVTFSLVCNNLKIRITADSLA